MKKGDILELDVTDINNLGCGIGRADGKVVFVKGAVTGDRVRTIIIKDNKSYAVGRLDAVISPSAHRESVEFCTAPLSCGGCVYRHVSNEHELTVKKNHVRAAFDKAELSDVTVLDVVGTMQTNGYRNKAQYPVIKTKSGMRSGFYASKTHTVIPVDNCSIQNPIFADITSVVCELCDKLGISAYDELSGKGLLRHIYLRVAEETDEVMLCMVVNGSYLPCEKQFADEIVRRFPNVVSVMLNENTENTNVVLGKKYRTLYGKDYIEDVLCGLRFLISPDSFYQVNRRGAELLYSLARDAAALTGNELLADLYCGTGTIGLSIAADVRELIGIEIVEGAVKCAKQNAEYNGITNANFFCGDASSPQTVLNATGGKCPDVVVIDPPRKGSTKELVDCLAELRVPRIVYVSCDATTLARDCAWFREAGYEIGAVQPVDMFPRTGHVESVVCLTKSDNAT